MKMKRILVFLILALCFSIAPAQHPYLSLDQQLSQGGIFVARDSISLKTGFRFSGQNGQVQAKLDEEQILDETYVQNIVYPDIRELNTQYAVGSIQGSFNVTPTGAATYSIPIAVPPGTAGMQPNLAISYSSQSGNGLLGMGWNLAGISMITRTGTTLYHDGFIDGVDFDGNDAFTWNGQRLIECNALGNGDTLYATEAESYTRIIAHGASGNGPLWWTVIMKDGTEMQFGYTEDSRHQEQNSSGVLRWMLNKVTDRKGNYMKYHYHENRTEGSWRLDFIEYTGNAGASPPLVPYNKVKFYYSLRSDVSKGYVGGSQVKNDLLLRKIRTFAEGDFAREYRFTYFEDEFSSHLNEIIEVAHTGERLNSTVVGWGNSGPDLMVDTTGIFYKLTLSVYDRFQLHQMVPGDYNGDGIDDVFLVYKPTTGYASWLLKWYDFTSNIMYDVEEISDPGCLNLQFSKGDFNGDGWDDLLRIWTQDHSPDWCGMDLYMNNKSGMGSTFTFSDNNGSISNTSVDDSPRFIAIDIDGDQESEVLRFFYDRTGSKKYILQLYEITSFGSQFTAAFIDDLRFDNTNLFSPYEFIDLNGNGKAEVMYIKDHAPDDQFRSYEYNASSGGFEKILQDGYPTQYHERFYGDFNGDGKTDILSYVDGTGWELLLCNGSGFISQTCPITNAWNPPFTNIYTTDVNGDGLCDIVEIYPSTSHDNIRVHYSRGSSFWTYQNNYEKDVLELVDNITYYGDFAGDGGADFIFDPYELDQDNHFLRLQFRQRDFTGKTTTIANGLNELLTIEYDFLEEKDNFYTKPCNSNPEVFDYAGPIVAVKNIISDLGNDVSSEITSYFYKGLKIHKSGKGILGMSEFSTKNDLQSKKSITFFDFNTQYYFSYLSSTELYGGDGMNTLTNSTVNNYTIFTPPGEPPGSIRFVSRRANNTATDHLSNVATTTTYNSYDNSGNLTSMTVDYNEEGSITTTTSYTGGSTNPSGCDYLPDNVTKVMQRTGVTSITIETDYAYNSDGTPDYVVNYHNSTMPVTQSFTLYDDFGNVLATSLSASGLTTRTGSKTYDTKGRFAISQTNAMGWTSSAEYDHRTGQVLNTTDINGLETHYRYDGFGRNTYTSYPDGTNSTSEMAWYTGTSIANALYQVTEQSTGTAPVTAWYDRLGRELLSKTISFDGSPVYVESQYDTKGRLWKVSEPYFTAPSQYTTYTYDPMGRNTLAILPTGVELHTDYSQIAQKQVRTYKQHNSTIWEDVTKTMNAFGEPVTVNDDGGTISYAYNSSGMPISITAHESTISITYDIHGNRHILVDPDAGLITTDYNAFGELVSQTDARDNTYDMYYDVLGRMYRRDGPDGELTTWTYENTVAGKLGTLTSVALNNGTSQSYTYDALGRITSQTETTGSENFTKTYTYDAYGRVEYENWHSGFGIRNVYNNYSYLSMVKTQDNETVWSAPEYNARGQVTAYDLGIDYKVSREYDAYGFPTRIKTRQTGSLNDIENFVYDFDDKRGNLNGRDTYRFYRFEDFTYDALDRLVTETVSSTQHGTSYAANGNITSRTDIGSYEYDQIDAGPHAVTEITTPTGPYAPAANQTVVYSGFNKASLISQNGYSCFITYGPDRQRRRMALDHQGADNLVLSKYYAFGDFERETDANGTRQMHYIAGGDGLAAIYVKYDTGADSLYYVMQDHLGSIVGAINSESDHVYRQSFDAWGRKRNPQDWSYNNIPDDFPFLRGYTGHEHLKWFGLINMNGRMYDAGLCRFISPDPYVQMPDNSQNFNRYSYCLNNPLVYTDPSGEFAWVPFLAYMAVQGIISGDMAKDSDMGFWGGFALGAGTAAITMGISPLIGPVMNGPGILPGAVNEMVRATVVGSITYGATSLATGGPFNWQGWGSNIAIAGAMGGLQGGIDAYQYNHLIGPRPLLEPSNISLFTGQPNLEEKLRIALYANAQELLSTFGEAGVGDVLVGNNANLKSYGYRNASGNIYVPPCDAYPEGAVANGLTLKGKPFDLTLDGYARMKNNTIILSKKTIRGLYKLDASAKETLFHEWFHSNDFYEGNADWLFQINGRNNQKMLAMLEFRAHTFNYSRFPTRSRLTKIETYARRYFAN